MKIFERYNSIWKRDRDEKLKAFEAKDPHVSEYENKIKYYEGLAASINARPEFLSVGPFAVFTGINLSLFYLKIRMNFCVSN